MTDVAPVPAALKKFVQLHKKGVSAQPLVWEGDFMGIDPKLLPPTRIRPYAKMGKVTATVEKSPFKVP